MAHVLSWSFHIMIMFEITRSTKTRLPGRKPHSDRDLWTALRLRAWRFWKHTFIFGTEHTHTTHRVLGSHCTCPVNVSRGNANYCLKQTRGSEYTLEEFLQALCWGKLTSKEEEEKQDFTIMFRILHNSHICVAFTNTVTSAAITSETVTSEPRL